MVKRKRLDNSPIWNEGACILIEECMGNLVARQPSPGET